MFSFQLSYFSSKHFTRASLGPNRVNKSHSLSYANPIPMQTKTFTQRLFRQYNLLKFFAPVFAILFGLGTSQKVMAQTQYGNSITLTQQPTGASSQSVSYAGKRSLAPFNTYTRLGNASSNPAVPTPRIGTYDLNNTSALNLTGGDIVVQAPGRFDTYVSAQVLYRLYLDGTPVTTISPAFSRLNLVQMPNNSFGDYVYSTSGVTGLNLLNGLTSGGDYTIEVIFQLSVSDGTTTTTSNDPSSSYTLSFYVTPPPFTPAGGTTTWISTTNTPAGTDWNNAANWSNGVPTATSNAVINAPTSTVRYAYPVLDSPAAGPINTYSVNNLTLNGSSNSIKGQVFVQLATLAVYGNIRQPAGGLVGTTTGTVGVADPNRNSTLVLAGADQVISGQLNMPDVVVAGSGIKSVINVLASLNTLSFRPTSVIDGVIVQSASEDNINNMIVTVFNTTGNTYIDLGNSGLINQAAGFAETNSSYVKGVLRASRRMNIGVTQTFGNIGVELTPNHTPVGAIGILRVIGEPQLAPIGNGVGVKRVFTIRGDDDSETSAYTGSGSFVRFRYLDSKDELNTIQEENLLLFLSFNLSGPYAPRVGTVNTALNYYDRNFLESYPAYNLTLGDQTRPLPVTLTKFDAKRMGTDALVTWQTASEQNSKGYEVQVSTDGKTFRTLSFVESKSPNSATPQSYSYLDKESGKTGARYYRLHQIDVDGKETFFTPVAVSFDGKASAASTLVAYPNPFNGNDDVHVALQSPTTGTAKLLVTDMMGRTIRQQSIELTAGLTDVSVAGLAFRS